MTTVTTKTKKTAKAKEPAIPFSQLEVSRWNRSRGASLDPTYIKELAQSIKRDGLYHRVMLVRIKGESGMRFAILAGAHRVEAIRSNRGPGSGLMCDEFVIRDGLDEENPECLAVSVAENRLRRDDSPADLARQIDRISKDQGIDQGEIGKLIKLPREKVNRLAKLAGVFEKLPAGWQKDLSLPARELERRDGSVITLSHWLEVAGRVNDDGDIPPELTEILETAHKLGASTRQLREALKSGGFPKQPLKGKGGKSSASPNVIARLKDAETHIRDAAELIRPLMPAKADEMVRFADNILKVIDKMEEIEAKRKAEKEAAKRKKEADRAAKKAKGSGTTKKTSAKTPASAA